MMRSKRAFVVVAILLVSISITNTSANLPPPIERTWTESGGLYCVAGNVSMPQARVNASIHLQGSWNYSVNVSCRYTILSIDDKNLTTAFVYPSVWNGFASTTEHNVTMHNFEIPTNGSIASFEILEFDEFREHFDLNQTDWFNVRDCEFALFNLSINSWDPYHVDVNAEFSVVSYAHNFVFEYIVDTARGWEGNTHEVVKVQFDRDANTEIIEYRHSPIDYSLSSGTDYTATVTWDFSIHDFEFDRVVFTVQQKGYPEYNPIPRPPIAFFIFAFGPIVIFGTALAVLRRLSKRGRQGQMAAPNHL